MCCMFLLANPPFRSTWVHGKRVFEVYTDGTITLTKITTE
jgi:hypothetical protein